MKEVKKEIDKEFYDKCMAASYAERKVLVEDFLGASIVCGYGLYGFNLCKEEDKYYLIYTRGDTCD